MAEGNRALEDFAPAYLGSVRDEYRKARNLAEGAMQQISEGDFDRAVAAGSNTIRVLMQHVGGNLRSRFSDFLTSDGEKPDRRRDAEFESASDRAPAEVRAVWEAGWDVLFRTLDSLGPEDLLRTVTIRGEPHTVIRALERSLAHISYHVGQIVYVAKAIRGAAFESLSIPLGESDAFLARVRARFAEGDGDARG